MTSTTAQTERVRIRPGGQDWRQRRDLIAHLAVREVSSMHRLTLLGWTWPLARQLAQFGVLLVVFGSVLSLDIPDYPAFVFSGLLAWAWFAAGFQQATSSILDSRHLVLQPGFPTRVLPVVAVAVPLIDFCLALPVMVGILVFTTGLHPTILLLPVVMAVQFALTLAVGWFAAALVVYIRDVRQIVAVGLLLVFYLTPVFYDHNRVPGDYAWLFDLNPLTTLLSAYRDVLLAGDLPDALPFVLLAAGSALLAVAGHAFFRRLEPGFVDEL